jgi:deferrochelatase/peroxidase EfeB
MKPIGRRAFLTRSAAALSAGAGGLAAAKLGTSSSATAATPSTKPPTNSEAWRVSQTELSVIEPFNGPYQAGILTPRQAQATFVALDSFAPDRSTLADALQALSNRARDLTVGGANPLLEVDAPPADSGILGPSNTPDSLSVTIAFGASLFDGRYGLASRRPRELTQMPNFPNDDLDPARSHGDVLLQICAGQPDTVVHTLRELMRTVRGSLQLRWVQDGFQGANRGPSPHNNARNLFAFRDGTSNPDTTNATQMRQLVWAGSGEPAWAAGGTYQVVRLIRQHVEFWDRVGLTEQQNMIGRVRDSGAPLGGTNEFDDPRYDLDPHGKRIPLDAHIRLANPRTAPTANQRILRRGYNYTRGFDAAGQLDQGLIFVAFNQSIQRQFVAVQNRLASEPMTDYVTPVGGGYFFAPPGARGSAEWVGSGLFAAA